MTSISEFNAFKKQFIEKYKNVITQRVMLFEDERKKQLSKTKTINIVGIIFSIIVLPLAFRFIQPEDIEALIVTLFVSFMPWLIAGTIIGHIFLKFETKIKVLIMPAICSCFGELVWSQKEYDGFRIIDAASFLPRYSRVDYDDIFKGTYKDTPFQIVETKLEEKQGKHTVTVFDGVIVRIKMNKEFSGHTVVKTDSLLKLDIPIGSKLRHTTLEDVEFENKFDVYTTDEIEARYLLTPAFMEKINLLETVFRTNCVRCAFYKQEFFLALDGCGDLFEVANLNSPLDDPKPYYALFDDIVSVLNLIEYFKLTENN